MRRHRLLVAGGMAVLLSLSACRTASPITLELGTAVPTASPTSVPRPAVVYTPVPAAPDWVAYTNTLHQPGGVAGFQALLCRLREASRNGPSIRRALAAVEELAQLLALGDPARLDRRTKLPMSQFALPGLFPSSDRHGPRSDVRSLLYPDQIPELICLLGFDFAFADRFRRALATGRRARRIEMDRELEKTAQLRRSTDEQFNALLALLQ